MAGDPQLTQRESLRQRAENLLTPKWGSEERQQTLALRGIGTALVALATPDYAVTAMRTHAAEHDCVLELRLIDLDTFGVTCSKHKEFHLEWRT